MKRSPINRGTSALRRTPLAQVGRRKKGKAGERAKVCKLVRERDVTCRFFFYISAAPAEAWHGHCSGKRDVHEIVPRSVWPDGDLDPENCVLLCRHHHDWIDHHRQLAEQIGLYRRSKPVWN